MTPENEGRNAAEAFRNEHGLGSQPLGDLVSLIEKTTEHDVAVLDTEGADEHGLTMKDPKQDMVFIAVARARNPMRQRSTLAHELSHVIFEDWFSGPDSQLSSRTHEEKRADAFARHLLIPQEGIENLVGHLHRDLTEADLSLVVQHFLVSPPLAAIALCNGGYISDTTKTAWMQLNTPTLATRFGWSQQYAMLQSDGDRPRLPQRLLTRTIAGYEEGVVSAQTIAVLRNIDVQDAIDELEAAGIFPSTPTVSWMDANDLPDVSVFLDELDEELDA